MTPEELENTPPPPGGRPAGRGLALAASLGLVVVCAAIYANSLQGPFVFDDLPSIRESESVRSLNPLSESLTAPGGTGASGRPLVALSLAVNYAIGELEVFGYHLFNVAVHALAALALFGLVRRTLEATRLATRALPVAFATALLWVVHPLHTDTLNHVVYRNEAMGALFYLLTLYAAVRGFRAERSTPWVTLSVLACALAMASKEAAVSAPLAVLALDRMLFSGGFLDGLKRRKGLYLGLAATWGVLALSIASGDRGTSAGFEQEVVSGAEYLRTQAVAIVQYLRLSLWPDQLLFDYYNWPTISSWGEVWLRGLALIALLAVSTWAFIRRRVAGYLGLFCFAVLAPSSSFIPLTGEMIAEHRMYLPLAALVLLLVLGVDALLQRAGGGRRAFVIGGAAVLLGGGALAWRTVTRNEDYRSTEALWGTVLERYPDHPRAHQMLSQYYVYEQDWEAALPHCQAAMELDDRLSSVEFNLGTTLMNLGRSGEALPFLQHAVKEEPEKAITYAQLGLCLKYLERPEQALQALRKAAGLDPDDAVIWHNLANFLIGRGAYGEAAQAAKRAIEADSNYVAGHHDLGAALLNAGRAEESIPYFRKALELDPGVARRHRNLALALQHAGREAEAARERAEANRLEQTP